MSNSNRLLISMALATCFGVWLTQPLRAQSASTSDVAPVVVALSEEPRPIATANDCRKNRFNRDTAEKLPIALTDWHCAQCRPNEFCRAGFPDMIREHAHCSNNEHYSGWWVGGGTLFHNGSAPCFDEGTWGWDYLGTWNRKRVWLNWSHGAREQGGRGAYTTDGPKLELHK